MCGEHLISEILSSEAYSMVEIQTKAAKIMRECLKFSHSVAVCVGLEAKKFHLFRIEFFALSVFARITASFSSCGVPRSCSWSKWISFESESRENCVGYTKDVEFVTRQCKIEIYPVCSSYCN
jgi:hypothetical protein